MQPISHRTVRPVIAQPPMLSPVRRRATQQPRAQLDGLVVVESSFGEWLAAGGDRRTQPRLPR